MNYSSTLNSRTFLGGSNKLNSMLAVGALTLPAVTSLARNMVFSDAVSTSTVSIQYEEPVYANTAPKALTHTEAATIIRQVLLQNGLTPNRESTTSDGSTLFQFIGNSKACVDFYPEGDLIVLLKKDAVDEIHELLFEDSERMIELLKDAGVA
jgi:hypothetical protein